MVLAALMPNSYKVASMNVMNIVMFLSASCMFRTFKLVLGSIQEDGDPLDIDGSSAHTEAMCYYTAVIVS